MTQTLEEQSTIRLEDPQDNDEGFLPIVRFDESLADRTPVIVGDPKTEQLLCLAESVAQTPSTVLLSGESGVGKEVFARYVHHKSKRADQPFVGINCAALPPSLLESELFGHEKGAFSGAKRQHRGVFEQANGGTLLLDEISETPPELQAKLLRVLQERKIRRVGGSEDIELNIRIIATTNRDLQEWVDEGRFRADLYYRLNVFPMHLPPLRQRPGDISPIARFVLGQMAAKMHPELRGITTDAVERLERYGFPGNVRELVNILERATIVARTDDFIRTEHLRLQTNLEAIHPTAGQDQEGVLEILPGERTLSDVQREIILNALVRFEGNRTRTAEALGVSVRTIRNRLRNYREEGYPIPG